MRILIIVPILMTSCTCWGQKFSIKDSGANIDKKLSSALRYDYSLTSVDSSDYQIEAFFMLKKKGLTGYAGYYKLYDKEGKEIYKSEEWRAGGYGGQAENKIIDKIVNKDLPKFLKANYNK